MNCKNCNTQLNSEDKYCSACGAKVVNKRITLKNLLAPLLASFGWDNRFFVTLKDLIIKPQFVFEKYLNGTRKKYTNPLTFFAIGTALSVFVFNFYSDELIQISNQASLKQTETIVNSVSKGENNIEKDKKASYLEESESTNKKIFDFVFKYYYYLSFLLLPFYALIAFLVFGKPNNYAEHLVINAYLQGLTFFFGLVLFFITLLTRIDVYSGGSILLAFVYYSYAYKKFHSYSFGRLVLKILKFFAILILSMLLFGIFGFIIAMLKGA